MQKWQYMKPAASEWGGKMNIWINSIKVSDKVEASRFHDYLNKLGSDGWEMINMTFTANDSHEIFYFKRPIE